MLSFRHLLSCFLLAATTLARAATVGQVTLPNSCYDFAVNPESGVLAAVAPDNQSVDFYPQLSAGATAAGVTSVSTPGAPFGIVFKKYHGTSYFAVICRDNNMVVLFDATTLKKIKDFPLTAGEALSLVTSSNPDDPYLYYCGAQHPQQSTVYAIDLRVAKDAGPVSLSSGLASFTKVAVSADGSTIYPRNTLLGGQRVAVNVVPDEEGKPPITSPLYRGAAQLGEFVPDPFGLLVANGRDLFSTDLSQKVGTLDTPPVCFLPHKPLIIGLQTGPTGPGVSAPSGVDTFGRRGPALGTPRGSQGQSLTVFSFNSLKLLGTVDLGVAPAGDYHPPVRNATVGLNPVYVAHVLADPKNDNVLVCGERLVQILHVSDLGVPDEPLLAATVEGNTQMVPGQRATLKLSRKDPSLKVELKDAPQGMTLAGDSLTWTPGPESVGTVTVNLQISSGRFERTQPLSFRVARGSIHLPFLPELLTLSSDASLALLVTSSERPNTFQSDATSRLALVNVKSPAVLADRSFLTVVSTCAIDNQYVYLAARDADAFYVLSRKDLSEVKRLFSKERVTNFVCADGKVIVQTRGPSMILNPADFSLSTPDFAQSTLSDGRLGSEIPTSGGLVFDVGDAIYTDGIFFDRKLAKIKALQYAIGIRTLRSEDHIQVPPLQEMVPQSLHWGIWVDTQGNLHQADRDELGTMHATASVVMNSRPVVVSLVVANPQPSPGMPAGPGGTRIGPFKGELVFRDVVTGMPQQNLPLFSQTSLAPAANFDGFGNPRAALQVAGDRIAVAYGDRLFVVDLPDLDPAKFPSPPQLSADQGVVVLQTDKPTTLRFSVTGGSGPFEYALSHEVSGFEIDRATGTVTIEPRAILDAAATMLGNPGSLGVLPTYQKSSAAMFKWFTGRDPQGIPAALQFVVTVRDRNMQMTQAQRVVLLDVAHDLVDEKLKRWQTAMPVNMPNPNQPATAPAGDSARIAALEKRIDALEAKIDLLTKIVSERNK